MADRVSKLPRAKKKIPIGVIRTRLRNHLDLVLASNNEALIRMLGIGYIGAFFNA